MDKVIFLVRVKVDALLEVEAETHEEACGKAASQVALCSSTNGRKLPIWAPDDKFPKHGMVCKGFVTPGTVATPVATDAVCCCCGETIDIDEKLNKKCLAEDV